jgi:hypothetical protein
VGEKGEQKRHIFSLPWGVNGGTVDVPGRIVVNPGNSRGARVKPLSDPNPHCSGRTYCGVMTPWSAAAGRHPFTGRQPELREEGVLDGLVFARKGLPLFFQGLWCSCAGLTLVASTLEVECMCRMTVSKLRPKEERLRRETAMFPPWQYPASIKE